MKNILQQLKNLHLKEVKLVTRFATTKAELNRSSINGYWYVFPKLFQTYQVKNIKKNIIKLK